MLSLAVTVYLSVGAFYAVRWIDEVMAEVASGQRSEAHDNMRQKLKRSASSDFVVAAFGTVIVCAIGWPWILIRNRRWR